MKNLVKHAIVSLIALLLAPLAALPAAEPLNLPTKEKFHLFLLIGQSNMAGRGIIEAQDRIPHPRVTSRWVSFPAPSVVHRSTPGSPASSTHLPEAIRGTMRCGARSSRCSPVC